MNPDKFYCIMSHNVFHTNPLRTQLLKIACELAVKSGYRRIIRHPDMEGYVTTEYKGARIGTISGITFTAKFETELGEGEIQYIVRPVDISGLPDEKFQWFEGTLEQ